MLPGSDSTAAQRQHILDAYGNALGTGLNQRKLVEQLERFAHDHPAGVGFMEDFERDHPVANFAHKPYEGKFHAVDHPLLTRVFHSCFMPAGIEQRILGLLQLAHDLGNQTVIASIEQCQQCGDAATRDAAFRAALVSTARVAAAADHRNALAKVTAEATEAEQKLNEATAARALAAAEYANAQKELGDAETKDKQDLADRVTAARRVLTGAENKLALWNDTHTGALQNAKKLSAVGAQASCLVAALQSVTVTHQPSNNLTTPPPCGMLARDRLLAESVTHIKAALLSRIKEVNTPLSIIAAPRQGKSLFLDEIARGLMPGTKVIKITFNGTAQPHTAMLPQAGAAASEVSQHLAGLIFQGFLMMESMHFAGCKDEVRAFLKSAGIFSATDVIQLIRLLLPLECDLVLLFDEFTKFASADTSSTVLNELLGALDVNFTFAFSGFNAVTNRSIQSVSGRKPKAVDLTPVLAPQNRRQLLPLKTFLTLYVKSQALVNRSAQSIAEDWALMEFAKSTPGVLGAVIETIQRDNTLNKAVRSLLDRLPVTGTAIREQCFRYLTLFQRYAQSVMASGSRPETESPLHGGLGNDVLSNYVGSIVDGCVFVPPIFFAYALTQIDQQAVGPDVRAAVNALEKLKEWMADLLKPENENEDHYGDINGARFEEFTAQCRAYRYLTLDPSRTVSAVILDTAYPFKAVGENYSVSDSPVAQPGAAGEQQGTVSSTGGEGSVASAVTMHAITTSRATQIEDALTLDTKMLDPSAAYIMATKPNTPLVDIVEREGDVERWIQLKLTAHSPFSDKKTSTRKHFRAALMTLLGANSKRSPEKKVRRLEYCILRPQTQDYLVQMELMKNCFDPALLELEAVLDGLSVSYRMIPITSLEGEVFLGPFFALAVPSADRFDVTSWERPPPCVPFEKLKEQAWSALNTGGYEAHIKGTADEKEFLTIKQRCETMRDKFQTFHDAALRQQHPP
jgi:hypothetical protein